jgi:hypothetical protein
VPERLSAHVRAVEDAQRLRGLVVVVRSAEFDQERADEIIASLRKDPTKGLNQLIRLPWYFAGVGLVVGMLVGVIVGVVIS